MILHRKYKDKDSKALLSCVGREGSEGKKDRRRDRTQVACTISAYPLGDHSITSRVHFRGSIGAGKPRQPVEHHVV